MEIITYSISLILFIIVGIIMMKKDASFTEINLYLIYASINSFAITYFLTK